MCQKQENVVCLPFTRIRGSCVTVCCIGKTDGDGAGLSSMGGRGTQVVIRMCLAYVHGPPSIGRAGHKLPPWVSNSTLMEAALQSPMLGSAQDSLASMVPAANV